MTIIVESKPLKSYNKRIGHNKFCERNIYSDLIAACPSKKNKNPCLYCFNENLENLYGFKRGFKLGFTPEDLDRGLNDKEDKISTKLKQIGVVRINANSDFYPKLDDLHSRHISIFTKNRIKVIAITKQDLIKIPKTMDAIKSNMGIVHVTFNFFDYKLIKTFEPDHYKNSEGRKRSIEYFIKEKNMSKNIVLRISPIIMGINEKESLKIVSWFKEIGGEMVCIEFLRNPNNNLKSIINKLGGLNPEFNGHYKEEQVLPLIKKIRVINKKLTICANEELNDEYGFIKDCCWL